jgi:hypothetical protein
LLSTPSTINLGVAFPLAFSHPQRDSFRDSLKQLEANSRSKFGMALSCHSISESDACVEVIGAIAPDDLFIVADMGGGSLDVAVVSARDSRLDVNSHLLQIGSIKYGGEICVRHLAGNGDPGRYWELRDSLAHSKPDSAFFSEKARTIYDLHIPRALEFIRVQIEALRKGDVKGQIKVFLVGNGWRLSTLTDQHQDPHLAFCARYQGLLSAMACANVSLWTNTISDGNPKHVVALGARKNAADGQRNELEREVVSGKLPCGRTMMVAGEEIGWWELVGPGGKRINRPDGDIKSGISQIGKCHEPTPAESWNHYLRSAIPGILPAEESIRQDLAESLNNGRFRVGPLQIILEKFWSNL